VACVLHYSLEGETYNEGKRWRGRSSCVGQPPTPLNGRPDCHSERRKVLYLVEGDGSCRGCCHALRAYRQGFGGTLLPSCAGVAGGGGGGCCERERQRRRRGCVVVREASSLHVRMSLLLALVVCNPVTRPTDSNIGIRRHSSRRRRSCVVWPRSPCFLLPLARRHPLHRHHHASSHTPPPPSLHTPPILNNRRTNDVHTRGPSKQRRRDGRFAAEDGGGSGREQQQQQQHRQQ